MRELNATPAVVLGVLGLFSGIFAPFALVTGLNSLRRIRASQGMLTGERSAAFGLMAGLLGTLLLVGGTVYWFAASA